MIAEPGKTYIRKVRATSSERDTLALQLRLSSALSAADLHPPGLPAPAIVCIRRFQDPLPGSLRLHRSGGPPPLAWEQAIRASLKQLVERAAYPAREGVPPNAEAVIFADRAEMLACLANDWCEGNVMARWWWQGLVRGKDIARLLVPAWLDTPEYIPAALQYLASKEKVVPFVRALRVDEVLAITQSIIRCFGLYELQFLDGTGAQEPAQPEQAEQPEQPEQIQESMPHLPRSWPPVHIQGGSLPRSAFAAVQPMSQARSIPENPPAQQPGLQSTPWQPWIAEKTGSELSHERQSLLGIGLMLVRAPAVVRTASFARAVQQWWSAAQYASSSKTFPSGKDSTIEDTPVQQQTKPGSARIAETPHEAPVKDEQAKDNHVEYSSIAEEESSDKGNAASSLESMQFTVSEAAEPSFQRTQLPVSESLEPAPEDTQVPVLLSETGEPAFEDTQVPVLSSETEEPALSLNLLSVPGAIPPATHRKQPGVVELFEAEIETELGGLFYLINLGLFLNLYGDFTTPLQPGISLSIWDFITLLGQQLLGVPTKTDRVWGLLEQLAGRREQDLPGKDFDPPASWRMPAEWLTPFPEAGTWGWNVNNGRLQVQHPEQFLVLDLPLKDDYAEEQLKREMQEFTDPWPSEAQLVYVGADLSCPSPIYRPANPYPDYFVHHHYRLALVGAPSPGIERWLGWLMPYVRVRLQHALGLANADDLSRILCKHAARILLTATHLDIVLSLAALPIEVRLSGLDRNPGWVPAAGRFVAFHFE